MPKPSALLARLRETAPLVQCITNYVAMNVAANVLLAAGASPAMVHAEEEAGEFAGLAGALTINIGTLSPAWIGGMKAAATGAAAAGRPWVLDPVAHFATALRRHSVAELLDLRPAIVRGNASEIIALAGGQGSGRGVDSGDPVELAEEAARRLAAARGAVVAVTGPVDFVTDGRRALRIHGGSPLMPRVTALGCSLTDVLSTTRASSRLRRARFESWSVDQASIALSVAEATGSPSGSDPVYTRPRSASRCTHTETQPRPGTSGGASVCARTRSMWKCGRIAR